MCGIAGIFGERIDHDRIKSMVQSQQHRGPDAQGIYKDPEEFAVLGHNRLKILDLSDQANQPMSDSQGRYTLIFNGEIYNYLELRKELSSTHAFKTQSDTEVLLAAYLYWGPKCLDRLIGMFAFAIWDSKEKKLFAARDRFGVKPLYYSIQNNCLYIASEIKSLHAAGVEKAPDKTVWANYLCNGYYGNQEQTFWHQIKMLPAGCFLVWKENRCEIRAWYDIKKDNFEEDHRSDEAVWEEYYTLLKESVSFRFRSDVSVGINLSGGLDSSLLLSLVQEIQGKESDVKAYTFVTGDTNYDELTWVHKMLKKTKHPSRIARLSSEEVPQFAKKIGEAQDEPFGGIPTLAYAKIFEKAREDNVTVLMDGQGLDEQWAGYDYYANNAGKIVQGGKDHPVHPECLNLDFIELSSKGKLENKFENHLRNLQYRDLFLTKIPRALRFNDRISMHYSRELREPFLDHRLVELAFRQPDKRKIRNGLHKWLIRTKSEKLIPQFITNAPKRALQTPQREWLRGALKEWAETHITRACQNHSDWLNKEKVRNKWNEFLQGKSDNSFYVWQWISLSLMVTEQSK